MQCISLGSKPSTPKPMPEDWAPNSVNILVAVGRPRGFKYPNIRASGPKYLSAFCILGLKLHYLGNWTLRERGGESKGQAKENDAKTRTLGICRLLVVSRESVETEWMTIRSTFHFGPELKIQWKLTHW